MIKNFYRLNTFAEKSSLLDGTKDDYYGIVLNAHVASYMESATVSFVRSLDKNFIVDPVTYVFSQDPSCIMKGDKIKQSIISLLDNYGNFASGIINQRQFKPSDFLDGDGYLLESNANDFINNVVSFQLKLIPCPEQDTFAKYFDDEDDGPGEMKPYCIIPPYFYAEELDNNWYSISLKLAKQTKKLFPDEKIYPVICLNASFLDSELTIDKVINDYSDGNIFDGYFLWFSDFDELNTSDLRLKGFIKLISELKNATSKEILCLYGGFCCLLSSKVGLDGFVSSLSYGEKKAVDQSAKGGAPPTRYYLPFVRKNIPISDVRTFVIDHPEIKCNCSVCQAAPGFPDVLEISKKHFIKIKRDEIRFVENSSIATIRQELENDLNYLIESEYHIYKSFEIKHLKKWLNLLDLIESDEIFL